MRAVQSVATIALLTLLMAGCGSKNGQQKTDKPDSAQPASGDATELVILCGSSFRPPTEELMADFTKATGIKATYSTGGSEDLLPHVQMKKKGDIFITHDPFLDKTKEAGAYADHVHVGYVAPVLAVQKGNPKGIKSIDDLAKPGLKVALSNPKYSTCGEMVEKLLKKKGIYDAVMKNVGTRLTKGHENLGNHLKMKTVDAVIMWNGVANTYKEHLELVKTPYEYDEEKRVHVIALNYSKQPEAVKKFIAFVRENGERAFAEKGYVK
jgi:molybdate transport system substrate-binding protein